MTTATIEGTEALMKHKMTAVILATGGSWFGARRLFIRQARLWGRTRQCSGVHRTICQRSESGAGYFNREMF
jgi:hypothetical protein